MIVVTGTSVVLNLCWLRQEVLLASIYEQVIAPSQVRAEFKRKAAHDPRFRGLRFPDFIVVAEPTVIPRSLDENPDLDAGEKAALSLALERGISDLLIDEQAGRAAAVSVGLRVLGLLGILIEAKERRLIARVGPLIDDLMVEHVSGSARRCADASCNALARTRKGSRMVAYCTSPDANYHVPPVVSGGVVGRAS